MIQNKFIPGKQLSEMFYKEAVKPLLEKEFRGLRYSAAIIGSGSEVLGFDTRQSTDHHWGPRVMVFISEKDFKKKKAISEYLAKNLPSTFRGFSTNFGEPDYIGVQLLREAKEGQAINHRVEIYTIRDFFKDYIGFDVTKNVTTLDWLTIAEQKLRTIRSGVVFHDSLGLKKIQDKFKYYPKDVWLFMMASEWAKIGQEGPFMGRCGDVGDEIGSSLVAGRMVHAIMRLCFLIEKEYAPYSKWFGTAFSRLKCAKKLTPILEKALKAKNWKVREKHMSKAYETIAKMHNGLRITKPLATKVSNFHERPYLVIRGNFFANEIIKKIKDKVLRKIPASIGTVNQFTDTVDILEDDKLLNKLKTIYK